MRTSPHRSVTLRCPGSVVPSTVPSCPSPLSWFGPLCCPVLVPFLVLCCAGSVLWEALESVLSRSALGLWRRRGWSGARGHWFGWAVLFPGLYHCSGLLWCQGSATAQDRGSDLLRDWELFFTVWAYHFSIVAHGLCLSMTGKRKCETLNVYRMKRSMRKKYSESVDIAAEIIDCPIVKRSSENKLSHNYMTPIPLLSPSQTLCDCGHIATAEGCTTGYGIDRKGKKICFACCGERDKAEMLATGRAVLYLARNGNGVDLVTNWPGTLKFPARVRKGNHNIAGTRYDAWFTGPDRKQWHGVNYGENSQICHCRRLKEAA